MKDTPLKVFKKRRSSVVLVVFIIMLIIGINPQSNVGNQTDEFQENSVLSDSFTEGSELAIDVLERLRVKGRAPKTGYSRSNFGDGWASVDGCDLRNIILSRSLNDIDVADDGCVVLSGVLSDPYTGTVIDFTRGSSTSSDVQIDHVVALSDAWQKGAQNISSESRAKLANDPLNLLAVDGPANQAKGDSDAASWLPSNKGYRCRYVARQIAVKNKYKLWVTSAEKSVMKRTINGCGEQVVPVET